MTYAAFLDDTCLGDVASNAGLAAWGRWVDTLDADEYPQLVTLREHGYTTNPWALCSEINRALPDFTGSDGVHSTLQGMRDLIQGAETTADNPVFFISDGCGDEGDEPEDEEPIQLSQGGARDPEQGRAEEQGLAAHAAFYDQLQAELIARLDAKKGQGLPPTS
jgi:hypothetical protein